MRKLASFAIPCCAAMLLASVFLTRALLLPAAIFCALMGAASLLFRPKRPDAALRVCLILLGFSLGLFRSWSYELLVLSPVRVLDGQTLPITAQLTDYPVSRGSRLSLEVRLCTGDGLEANAVLYTNQAEEDLALLCPGDSLSCTAALRFATPSQRSSGSYYLSKNIQLTGSIKGSPQAERAETVPLRYWPALAAHALKVSLSTCFDGDCAGFLTALLLGDKSALSPSLYTAMKRAGLAHIAAVSGLHVSFLAGFLGLLFSSRRRLGAFLTMILLLFFAAAVGNSPSVLRAVFLHATLLLAPLLGREEDRLTSLSAALLLLLLDNPYASVDVGLQLSFASAAGILFLSQPLYRRWTARLDGREGPPAFRLLLRLAKAVLASLSVTVGALLFTAPITALTFGTVSLLSPLSNLLTLWAVSWVFLGALFLALLALVFPAAALFLAPAVALPAAYICAVARWISRLPFASVSAGSPYFALWLGFTYFLVALYFLLFRRRAALAPLFCSSLFCLLLALVLNTAELRASELAVSVLDVGQGQSVLFLTGGKSVLVDCGGTGLDDPGDVAADAVQAAGSSRLDLLILTHYHADHAGGVPELLERLEVGALLIPDVEPENPLRTQILTLAREKGIRVTFLTDDAELSLGSARFRVFAPLGSGGGNEEGLSLLASQGEFDALVTGDMNATVERRLLKYGALPDIELLVAGHHGSASSTSEELLIALRPQWAAISCGWDNSYGHPAPETLERLGAADCAVYRTDYMGSITFFVRGDP